MSRGIHASAPGRRRPIEQRIHQQADGGERRFQLMGDRRDEVRSRGARVSSGRSTRRAATMAVTESAAITSDSDPNVRGIRCRAARTCDLALGCMSKVTCQPGIWAPRPRWSSTPGRTSWGTDAERDIGHRIRRFHGLLQGLTHQRIHGLIFIKRDGAAKVARRRSSRFRARHPAQNAVARCNAGRFRG